VRRGHSTGLLLLHSAWLTGKALLPLLEESARRIGASAASTIMSSDINKEGCCWLQLWRILEVLHRLWRLKNGQLGLLFWRYGGRHLCLAVAAGERSRTHNVGCGE